MKDFAEIDGGAVWLLLDVAVGVVAELGQHPAPSTTPSPGWLCTISASR
jgi:hypothetical protein